MFKIHRSKIRIKHLIIRSSPSLWKLPGPLGIGKR